MQKGIDYTGVSVVALCHDGQGNYLLEYRSNKCRDEHHTWSNVGGSGLEPHETLEEAVRREIVEECGATVFSVEPLGFREVFREKDGVKSHWIAFDFKAHIDPATATICEPEMCLEQQWFPLESFPSPLHSQFPVFLEKYKDKL